MKTSECSLLYLYLMSELLCAGKARKLHVKFSAFATSVCPSCGLFPTKMQIFNWTRGRGQTRGLPDVPAPSLV